MANKPCFVILEYGVAEGTENPTNHKTISYFRESDEHMSKIYGVIKKWQKEDFRVVSLPLQHAEKWLKDNHQDVIVLSASVGGFLSHGFLRQYKDEFYMACSAGNEGAEGEADIASYGYFTAIGAVDENLRPEPYSSYGKGLVEFAGIISRGPTEYTYQGKTMSRRLRGTSFSCPQHATEIANLMARYWKETGKKIRIADVLAIRNKNTKDVHEPGKDLKTGKGVYFYDPKQLDTLIGEKEEVLIKSTEFVHRAVEITKHPTLYALGGIGQLISDGFIRDVCGRIEWNQHRERLYRQNIGKRYAFDCVGLIKAILWDWSTNGINYAINGVPDIDANQMIDRCVPVTFKNLVPGCVVWMDDHIGTYIGNDKVIEATPAWKDGVQITALNAREWLRAGKLPWVDYNIETPDPKPQKPQKQVDNTPSKWAKEAWDWAKDKGITDGTEPKRPITREEMVTMLHRYSQLK